MHPCGFVDTKSGVTTCTVVSCRPLLSFLCSPLGGNVPIVLSCALPPAALIHSTTIVVMSSCRLVLHPPHAHPADRRVPCGSHLDSSIWHNTEPRILPYKPAAIVHVPNNIVCLTTQKCRFSIPCIKLDYIAKYNHISPSQPAAFRSIRNKMGYILHPAAIFCSFFLPPPHGNHCCCE